MGGRKRFAYQPDDVFQQITVDEPAFKGVVRYVRLQNVSKPKYVNMGNEILCIINNGYSLIEAYPDNGKYALTIMFDDCGKLIEWSFDIAKTVGTENGIPFEDDLYLDMVLMPSGEKIILDEDELLAAREEGMISSAEKENGSDTCSIGQFFLIIQYSTIRRIFQRYVCRYEQNIQRWKRFSSHLLKPFLFITHGSATSFKKDQIRARTRMEKYCKDI